MPKNEPPYENGYGKPPVSGRFKKGQSGNPKGRPKGSKNLAAIIQRESRRPVRVTGPGGSRLVTRLEATVIQLGNKAVQGDIRSQREYLSLVKMSEDANNPTMSPLTSQETDQQVMRNLIQRMARIGAESNSAGPETEETKS
jgi:hypothetical protein